MLVVVVVSSATAVVANRCAPDELADVATALQRFTPKSYVLPEEPLLAVLPGVALQELKARI